MNKIEDKCLKRLQKPSYNRPSMECYNIVDNVGGSFNSDRNMITQWDTKKIWSQLAKSAEVLGELRFDNHNGKFVVKGPKNLLKRMIKDKGKSGKRFKIIPIKNTGGILYDSRKNVWEMFLFPSALNSINENNMKKQELKILSLIKDKFKIEPNLFYQYIRNSKGNKDIWGLFLIYLKLNGYQNMFREQLVNKAIEIINKSPHVYQDFIQKIKS